MDKISDLEIQILLKKFEADKNVVNFYLHRDRYERYIKKLKKYIEDNIKNKDEAKSNYLYLKKRLDKKILLYKIIQKYIQKHEDEFNLEDGLLTKKEDGVYVISNSTLTTCDFTKEVLEYKLKEMPGIFNNPIILEPEKNKIINEYCLDEEKDELELKIRILNIIKKEEKDYEIQTTRK